MRTCTVSPDSASTPTSIRRIVGLRFGLLDGVLKAAVLLVAAVELAHEVDPSRSPREI